MASTGVLMRRLAIGTAFTVVLTACAPGGGADEGESIRSSAEAAVEGPAPSTGVGARTQLLSVGLNGAIPNGRSDGGAMSADGRYVAFTSQASNLVEGDTNNAEDVFLRDLRTNTTTRVNTKHLTNAQSTGTTVDLDRGSDPKILTNPEDDAHPFVLFSSNANLGAPKGIVDTRFKNIYIKNTSDGAVRLVTTAVDGEIPPNGHSFGPTADDSYPGFDFAGGSVSFSSDATNLLSQSTTPGGCYLQSKLERRRTDVLRSGEAFNGQCTVVTHGRYIISDASNVPGTVGPAGSHHLYWLTGNTGLPSGDEYWAEVDRQQVRPVTAAWQENGAAIVLSSSADSACEGVKVSTGVCRLWWGDTPTFTYVPIPAEDGSDMAILSLHGSAMTGMTNGSSASPAGPGLFLPRDDFGWDYDSSNGEEPPKPVFEADRIDVSEAGAPNAVSDPTRMRAFDVGVWNRLVSFTSDRGLTTNSEAGVPQVYIRDIGGRPVDVAPADIPSALVEISAHPGRRVGAMTPIGSCTPQCKFVAVSLPDEHRIIAVDQSTGEEYPLAGTGVAGMSGDGGSALQAQLSSPNALLSTGFQRGIYDPRGNPFGEGIYFADTGNRAIRVLSIPPGFPETPASISTYWGERELVTMGSNPLLPPQFFQNGQPNPDWNGFAIEDGVVASALAIANDGSLLVGDAERQIIWKKDFALYGTGFPGEFLPTYRVAGGGDTPVGTPGAFATGIKFRKISSIEAGYGGILVADSASNVVVSFGEYDRSVVLAGTGSAGWNGDGRPGSQTQLNSPTSALLSSDGTALYIQDAGNSRIRVIHAPSHLRPISEGLVETVIGTGDNGGSGVNGPPTRADVATPVGLMIAARSEWSPKNAPQANLLVADNSNGRILGTLTTEIRRDPRATDKICDLSLLVCTLNDQSRTDFDRVATSPALRTARTAAIDGRALVPKRNGSSIAAAGVGDVGDESMGGGLSASPMRRVPMRRVPLMASAAGRARLRNVSLATIPVDHPGGWADMLAGSKLADRPLQNVSLADVFDESLNPNLGTGSSRDPGELLLGELDLSDSELSDLSLAAVALGDVPVSSLPLPDSVKGATPVEQWRTLLAESGLSVDRLDPADPSTTLLAATLAGLPMRRVPLAEVPMRRVDLDATPIRDIGLGQIDISASQLRNVPMRRVNLDATTLGQIPMRRVDLAATRLGKVPLSKIGNLSSIVDCSAAGGVCANDAATLGDVPSAALIGPLAQLDPDLFDLAEVKTLLGELGDYGEATIGDVVGALLKPFDSLTLGDVLRTLIGREDYPWQDVDVSESEAVQGIALASGANSTRQRVGFGAVVPMKLPGGLEWRVELPPGWAYAPGSARDFYEVDTKVADPADPSSDVLVWPAGTAPTAISFEVIPSSRFTTTDVIKVEASVPEAPIVRDTAEIPATVSGEWEEPNNTLEQATPFAPETLAVAHIATAGDTDLFSVTVSSTGKLSAFLSGLAADLDLVLYGPQVAGLRGPATRSVIPVDDEDLSLGNDAAVPADVGDDISLLDRPVVAVSQNRGNTAERIESTTLKPGTYVLQVTGYNGATSDEAYVLRSTFSPQAAPTTCEPWVFPGGAPESSNQGELASPESFAGADTVFVVNRQRMLARFGASATPALAALDAFVRATDADPKLGVKAKVAFVDGDAEVRAAYSTWDTGANRCSPEVARGVTRAIGAVVDDIRAANPALRNVVVIGGDDIIPFGRVLDTTKLANESDYASTFAANNELSAALRDGYVLTDDPYGDPGPVEVGRSELFVPDLVVGRLIETPNEIAGALVDFVRFNGHLDAGTSAVAGYDFLSDGSERVASALRKNGLDPAELINDEWGADDLADLVLGEGESAADVSSVNAHFDHYRALPAKENQPDAEFDESKLFGLEQLAERGNRRLARSMLFSMGCHAGLSVADLDGGDLGADWAQAVSAQGGVWIGNTGFGYGDSDPGVVTLSEELMSLFAAKLDGTMTVGRALQLAKQRYVADRGDTITGYDTKVSQESTFYGLPMYRLQTDLKPPTGPGANPATATDPRVGLKTSNAALDYEIGGADGQLRQRTGDRGTYFSVDGQILAVQNRPIQPRDTREVTVADGTGSLTLDARGALVTALTSRDLKGVDPVVHRPTIDLSAREAEPSSVDSQFPSTLAAIGTYTDLIARQPDGTEVVGPRQQVVVTPGQFRGGPNPKSGTQRLFTSMDVATYYATPSDPDRSAPTISSVQATIDAGNGGFTVRAADAGDTSRVKRVYVLATDANSPGTWYGGDLSRGTNGWTGRLTLPSDVEEIDFFVQAVDASGNVATSSNKAVNFRSETPPAPDGEAPTIVAPSGMTSDGWVRGPAEFAFTGTALVVSVDGAEPAPVDGPVTITTEGEHTIVVTDAQNRSATLVVKIDSATPAATLITPADNATFTVGQSVNANFNCADGGSGIATCTGPNGATSGSPIDSTTPGAREYTITATDRVGNTTTVTHTYEIAPIASDNEAPIVTADLGRGITDIGFYRTGTATISGTYTDPDGDGPHTATIQWGDGEPVRPLTVAHGGATPTRWSAQRTFTSNTPRTVTITVCDDNDACGSDTIVIRPNDRTSITPIAQCVTYNRFLWWTQPVTRWGYDNPSDHAVAVPRSNANRFTIQPAPTNQPTYFAPGKHDGGTAVPTLALPLTWKLTDKWATAIRTLPAC